MKLAVNIVAGKYILSSETKHQLYFRIIHAAAFFIAAKLVVGVGTD